MTLDGVSELEIVMMDFSFDGKFLLVVTGVPKYEINIWDLELGRKYLDINEYKKEFKERIVPFPKSSTSIRHHSVALRTINLP